MNHTGIDISKINLFKVDLIICNSQNLNENDMLKIKQYTYQNNKINLIKNAIVNYLNQI